MSGDWTLGPAIRLRCPNPRCELHGQPEIIRPMRFGNVYMVGVWRCARCLFEMETVSKTIRNPEQTAARQAAAAPPTKPTHPKLRRAGRPLAT